MKNIIASLLTLISIAAHSQFFEGFEGTTFPPAGWTVSDNGVGTFTSWKKNPASWPTYAGSNCAFIDRENIGVGNTSEDWLVTPPVLVPINGRLHFFLRQTLIGSTGTMFQVKVSTTSPTDHSSFTTISSQNDGGYTLEFQENLIPLDSYTGQTIYVAFVRTQFQSTAAVTGDRWLLDNVRIGEFSRVSGTVTIAGTGTDCSSGTPLTNIQISTGDSSAFTNALGFYSGFTAANSINITAQIEHPEYYTINPPSYTFNPVGLDETANFCLTPNGIHPDLRITVIRLTNAKPGFAANYKLIYKNVGTETESGTVSFNFDDAVMNHLASYPQATTVASGIITWNFMALQPLETREIEVVFLLNSPVEIPPLNAGDQLNFSAAIVDNSVIDANTTDNQSILEQIVSNAQDPNDKTVSPSSVPLNSDSSGDLTYMIRFQNLGTAAAQNVSIVDFLDQRLNPDTFEMVSASHPYRINLSSGNKLEILFDNINLAASATDEPASHGYAAFRIKTSGGLSEGDVINNRADIFFDFNAAVTTNNAACNFYSVLASGAFEKEDALTVYPNPASKILNIATSENVTSIKIYNIMGQLMQQTEGQNLGKVTPIDIARLNSGTYLLEIIYDQEKMTKKFIKL